jgi:hypothetical protein
MFVLQAYQSSAGICFLKLAQRASGIIAAERSLKIRIIFHEHRRIGRPPGFAVGIGRQS